MSKPDVGVRWFCQAHMSASQWGAWGRGPAVGRAFGGLNCSVNLEERLCRARGRTA